MELSGADERAYTCCCRCNRDIPVAFSIICPFCQAVTYCSLDCRFYDYENTFNPAHAHKNCCGLMKLFMQTSQVLDRQHLQFPINTTSMDFSLQKLHAYLKLYGVFTLGLWKYLFHTRGLGPGDELKEYNGLIYEKELLEQGGSRLFEENEERALLLAYVNPSDVVLLSVRPIPCPPNPDEPSLLAVELCDWVSYYQWRGLPLTSPLAMIFHHALTMYFVLQRLFPRLGPEPTQRVLDSKSLHIHLLGVETELDLLPTFKELEFLISPQIEEIVITMIGPEISPHATSRVWYLSPRLCVDVRRGLYHDIFEELCAEGRRLPDVIMGFNVGLQSYDTWKATLELLSKFTVPVYFTDSCQYSVFWDLQVMDVVGLKNPFTNIHRPFCEFLPGIDINPFRSPLRIPNEGTRWSRYLNSLVFSPRITEDSTDDWITDHLASIAL